MESAAARICREGGARVTTNVMVRDMDLAAPHPGDARRLEIVADGLPLFGSAQLAIDTTLISTLHCDGSARPGTADTDVAASLAARKKKERTCPELVGRARLVVLAREVVGPWCPETRAFLSQLAKAKARHEPRILRQRVLGDRGGKRSCHARRKHSRGRCWNCAKRWALTAKHQRHTMCCAPFRVLWSRFLLTEFSSELCVSKKKNHPTKTDKSTTRQKHPTKTPRPTWPS